MFRLTHVAGLLCLAGLVLSGGAVWAGEKKLMHCFAFSPIESATDADWQAFFKATDAIPSKIPGTRTLEVKLPWMNRSIAEAASARRDSGVSAASEKRPDPLHPPIEMRILRCG